MTTPFIHGILSWPVGDEDSKRRLWAVDFEDSCGCAETEYLPTWQSAFRFAWHLANGGSRWEFVG